MKIIQVSDLHLVAPGDRLFGSNPLMRLEDCIADLNRHHADADLVVFSGDLTDNADPSAYAAMAERLSSLAAPYALMVGNHDDRTSLAAAFPDIKMEGGFIQSTIDLPGGRVVLADTLEPGRVEGRLCAARLAWLDAAIGGASDVLLFLHHPPVAIGIPSLDDSRLADAHGLRPILQRHCNVRHIFAGHVHLLATGNWCGVPFTTARSTNHQSALRFSGPHEVSFEAPAYTVVLARGGDVAVHFREFPCRRN